MGEHGPMPQLLPDGVAPPIHLSPYPEDVSIAFGSHQSCMLVSVVSIFILDSQVLSSLSMPVWASRELNGAYDIMDTQEMKPKPWKWEVIFSLTTYKAFFMNCSNSNIQQVL